MTPAPVPLPTAAGNVRIAKVDSLGFSVIVDGLNPLVNSDIVTSLCTPPSAELAPADWITKAAW